MIFAFTAMPGWVAKAILALVEGRKFLDFFVIFFGFLCDSSWIFSGNFGELHGFFYDFFYFLMSH